MGVPSSANVYTSQVPELERSESHFRLLSVAGMAPFPTVPADPVG